MAQVPIHRDLGLQRRASERERFFCFQVEHGHGHPQFPGSTCHLVEPVFQEREDPLFVLLINHPFPAL